ncbi:MAG: hypothetical protein II063_05990, partial [Prevotella sp.]|nr:hypothetical protein [Prevotella sp.]
MGFALGWGFLRRKIQFLRKTAARGTNSSKMSCRLVALFLIFWRKMLLNSKKVRIFTRFFIIVSTNKLTIANMNKLTKLFVAMMFMMIIPMKSFAQPTRI